jgi:outer membrane protein assembly factor BamA
MPNWFLVLVSLGVSSGVVQDLPSQAPPAALAILKEVHLEGTTVFTREDVVWLLKLREGSPLSKPPDEVARTLKEAYERDGYSEATVTGAFENGRLSLTVDEGRIDDIEIRGVTGASAERMIRRLGIKAGDIYNTRVIGRATARLTREAQGAFEVGQPRRGQPGVRRDESAPGDVILERRGGRHVLVVPLRWRTATTNTMLGSGREDLFSPVDGLSPAIGFSATIFDHAHFNHTYVNGYVSYKFSRDKPGYSLGLERPLFIAPRLFLGAELHDMTASDDRWRLASFEQTLASVAFKNTFRDYYRRRGAQLFGVFRMGANNELSAMARWDRHESLDNTTRYSFFRDDATYRPNTPVFDERVNAVVLGYTFDTRPLTAAGHPATYERHLKDSLFGYGLRQPPGLRLEWTSELAGRGMKGDADFDRHILNARGYVAVTSNTLLSLRGLFGFSNGPLPVERLFSLGGIGSVHGYRFKEVSGSGMTVLNAEYRINLARGPANHDAAHVFAFYDAGRLSSPRPDPRELILTRRGPVWLRGLGFGAGAGGVRVEFGFRANDIPRSRQILVRFSPTF